MGHSLTGIAQGGGLAEFLLPLVIIFGVFYFLVIRPQNKQRQRRDKMLSELKKGDKVVTNGGMLGTISGIRDGVVTLLISDKVRIRILQSHVGGLEGDAVGSTGGDKK